MDHLPPLTEDRGPMFLKASWVGVGFGVIFVALHDMLSGLWHLSCA